MRKLKFLKLPIILVVVLSILSVPMHVEAYTNPAAVPLGTVANFAALAATAVSSPLGGTALHGGDLGITGVGCTNFPVPCSTPGVGGTVIGGAIQNNNGVATTAETDATAAVTNLNTRGANTTIPSGLLDGLNLAQGVYDVPAAVTANLTNDLTLTGDANSIFIFRLASTFVTAGTSRVLLNGVQSCNVYWTVGSSATFNGTTTMVGTVFAANSITFPGGGANVDGRVIAQTAAITFNDTTITRPLCSPTASTTLSAAGNVATGSTVHDSATLFGHSSTSGGTLTYSIYTDSACTSLSQTVGTVIVTNGVVPDSSPITFNSSGTFYWRAAYSGDNNNNPVSSVCNSEPLTVTAPAAAPTAAVGAAVPSTGFAPQQVTVLSAQPAAKSYTELGDLWLEIPRLGVQMSIVGVPLTNGTWDVSWLGKNAGWLNGSAYPTWSGNSVLTGHVYDAFGNPGPFVHLNQLWWGDQVIVHAGGAKYIYSVREVLQIQPNDQAAMMKHQTQPWITLVTCRGYDQTSNSYKYRVLVRAVLVDVK